MNSFRQLLLTLFLLSPAVVQAQFTFTTNNGAITITSYTGSGGNVTIPSSTNGWPVTGISTAAFEDYSGLVTGISIPPSVTNIASDAIDYCPSLTNITVDAANPVYGSLDGVLFDNTQNTLLRCPMGLTGNYAVPFGCAAIGDEAFFCCFSLTAISLPSSLKSIGQNAFEACSGLTSVIVPDSVNSGIGDDAFGDCSSLTSITIGNCVTSIGHDAFDGCPLSSVTIGNSVANIGYMAFAACHLTSLTIPNSVTNIDYAAFFLCASLTNVMIGNSVTSIGNEAFRECYSLTSVTIPNSVISIGEEAFFGCPILTNIAVNAGNSNYASLDGVLFNKNLTTLVEYPKGLTGIYIIPNSVTSIGSCAFMDYSGSLTIPNSVTNIGYSAFYTASLTGITIGTGVVCIGEYAFGACSDLHQIYFQGNAPSGVGDDSLVFYDESAVVTVYYVPGTAGWSSTFGGEPTAPWYQPQPQILGSGYGLGVKSNRFNFTISWATNTAVVVEASTNLHNWMPVSTNTLVNGTNYFSDFGYTNFTSQFYRVRSQFNYP